MTGLDAVAAQSINIFNSVVDFELETRRSTIFLPLSHSFKHFVTLGLKEVAII